MISDDFNREAIALSVIMLSLKVIIFKKLYYIKCHSLQNSDLFSSWSFEGLQYLSRLCVPSNKRMLQDSSLLLLLLVAAVYQSQTVVYQKGEPSNEIFILVKGRYASTCTHDELKYCSCSIEVVSDSERQTVAVQYTSKSHTFGMKGKLENLLIVLKYMCHFIQIH